MSKADFNVELTAEQKKKQREEKKLAKQTKKTAATDKIPPKGKGGVKGEEKTQSAAKPSSVPAVSSAPVDFKSDIIAKPSEIRSHEEVVAKDESAIHRSFVQLKLDLLGGTTMESDELCLRLIEAFKSAIGDYKTPGDKAFKRGVEALVKPHLNHITDGHSLPISMGSLVKQLKFQMTELPENCSEEEGKDLLISWLEDFADIKINLARQSVSQEAGQRLINGCTVMIYSSCSLVEKVIVDANNLKQKFSVVVVGSSCDDPLTKEMLKRLVLREKINCTYVSLGAINYTLDRVKLIILSAEGLLANGNVIVKRGSTLLALAAQRRNIPVLVACPTYKFCEKVITGTTDPTLTGLGHSETEVMRGDLVTGVVTELRIQTCSAAPAVLKIKQPTFE